ncbi:hypothetical protein JCM16408A_40860 [Methylobacterium phyllosphaerae]
MAEEDQQHGEAARGVELRVAVSGHEIGSRHREPDDAAPCFSKPYHPLAESTLDGARAAPRVGTHRRAAP